MKKRCVTSRMSSTFVSNSLLTVSTSRVRSIPLINRSLGSSGSCASLILNGRFVKPVTLSNVFLLGYSRSSLQSELPEIPDAPKTSACFCALIRKIKTLTAVAGGYILKERNCSAVSILQNWMSRNTFEKSSTKVENFGRTPRERRSSHYICISPTTQ
jgi:hypothetical protein